jgi:hypothetical protein
LYHQFPYSWDFFFFGLATAFNAIQQAYGAADHNGRICKSLSIPKEKETVKVCVKKAAYCLVFVSIKWTFIKFLI